MTYEDSAAEHAAFAGVDMIELHGAHGYLINQFLCPLTNEGTDKYDGLLENRYLFAKEMFPVNQIIPNSV